MADARHVHPDLMHSSNQRRFPRIRNNLATDCFEIWYLHASAVFCNAFRYSQHVCSWIFCWSDFIFLLIPMLFFRFVGFVKLSTYRKPPALCFGFLLTLITSHIFLMRTKKTLSCTSDPSVCPCVVSPLLGSSRGFPLAAAEACIVPRPVGPSKVPHLMEELPRTCWRSLKKW